MTRAFSLSLSDRHSLLVNPHLAYGGQAKDFLFLLAGAEAGVKRQKEEKRSYQILSIGLGYMSHWEAVSESSVNLPFW